MNCIQSLKDPTPGLGTCLAEEDEEVKDWDRIRNHAGGVSYSELGETLVNIQPGLCAYCEIDIEERDRQVEHVIPQSDPQNGATLALELANMIAGCKGGALQTDDKARRLDPVRRNRSCGEAKEALVDTDFIDPGALPALPSLTRANFDGRMDADTAACEIGGIEVDKVEKTIEILGLNTERLRRARENRWNALSENWATEIADPELMEAAARGEVLPDEENRLPRFFTTSRSYFGLYGEKVLSELPQDWS